MSLTFDSEIAGASCGSRASPRRAPPSRSWPTWTRPSTTRPPTTASLPLSDTGSHARARTDDAPPNTRAGLDRAAGERPAARQKQGSRQTDIHEHRRGDGLAVRARFRTDAIARVPTPRVPARHDTRAHRRMLMARSRSEPKQ